MKTKRCDGFASKYALKNGLIDQMYVKKFILRRHFNGSYVIQLHNVFGRLVVYAVCPTAKQSIIMFKGIITSIKKNQYAYSYEERNRTDFLKVLADSGY